MSEPTCQAAGNDLFDQPCEGSLWECKRYYASGRSSYRCEKHAKEGMQMNPPALGGPRYVQMTREPREAARKTEE